MALSQVSKPKPKADKPNRLETAFNLLETGIGLANTAKNLTSGLGKSDGVKPSQALGFKKKPGKFSLFP